MSRRRRRKHVEEHAHHEAWAIPYGDLVTLLLAFFVTMYSISSVNAGKYRVLSDSLSAAFNGAPHSPQLIEVGAKAGSIQQSQAEQERLRLLSSGLPANPRMPLPQASGTVRDGQRTPGSADPRDVNNPAGADYDLAMGQRLKQMEADVSGALDSLSKDNEVNVQRRGDDLEVQISTDLLFGSGDARLQPAAVGALQSLAEAMKPWPNGVRVEGHTDDRPVRSAIYPSNWELSAARAASVVRLFVESGVAPDRLSVVGRGEFAPLMANDIAKGRSVNRRVAIIILGRSDGAGNNLSATGVSP